MYLSYNLITPSPPAPSPFASLVKKIHRSEAATRTTDLTVPADLGSELSR